MDRLTTDGIIERLKKIREASANGGTCLSISELIDGIINTRNKADITRQLVKAYHALQEFEWKQRLQPVDEVQKALAAIEGLLNAEVFLGHLGHVGSEAPKSRLDVALAEQIDRTLSGDPEYMANISADATRLSRNPKAISAAEQLESITAAEQLDSVRTYRAIFAAYLEGEFGELMRGSSRSMVNGEDCYDRAVERLRGHLGVTATMVPEICEGSLSFTSFMDRVSKERWKGEDRYIAERAKKQAAKLSALTWGQAARKALRTGATKAPGWWLPAGEAKIDLSRLHGPDGETIPLIQTNPNGSLTMRGPAYQQPIAPGRPGDMLALSGARVVWRSPDSDGRIDPTIFGAVRPVRI